MTGQPSLARRQLSFLLLLSFLPAAGILGTQYFSSALDGFPIWLVATLVGIATAMAGYLVLSRIGRGLDSIREAAGKYAEGNLAHRVAVSGSGTIDGALEAGLDRMAERLAERIRSIEFQGRQVETILSSMAESVIATDAAGKIVKCNDATAALFGVSRERLTGRALVDYVRSGELNDFISRSTRLNKASTTQISWHTEAGDRHLDVKLSPLLNDNGGSHGFVIVLTDITRLRHLEQARKEFVANVSHELKTPLTSIRGFAETLRDGAIREPEEARRFCEIITVQVDRLQAIIDDLLSLSRIEQEVDRGSIKLTPLILHDVLQSAILHISIRANEKQIKVECECPASLEIHAHEHLLEQAVINLVDNAIKYSDAGRKVLVRAVLENNACRIDITDEGIGIGPEHLERIFERFYRVEKSRSRKQGGTGLGLSIVKHIVMAHGGDIKVSSRPGSGSTFSIRLPLAPDNH